MADGTSWQVVPWLWEKRDEIWQALKGVYGWFRGDAPAAKRPGILILGPGGTGKTTLARLLSGRFDWLLDSPWQYDQSVGVEHYSLADDAAVEVVVPPGQEQRRASTWQELLAEIAAGAYRGIILLVSYGYHNLGAASYKLHPAYAGSKDVFVRAYLEDRRAEELRVLRHLIPHLAVAPGKVWLLTVVAKQDLWWDDRAEVERHYTRGEYQTAVADVVKAKGERSFRAELAFASLVISNLDTAEGERLARNTAGYDHRAQVSSVRRLFEVVGSLKQWEGVG